MTSKQKLKAIPKGEQATLRTTVQGEKVTTVHTVKPNGESQDRFNLTWTFDFSKVTKEELQKLAERTLRIKMQSNWRKAKDRMDAEIWDNRTFSVREILDTGRKSADPVEKVTNLVEKMSPEEKRALLEQLQAA